MYLIREGTNYIVRRKVPEDAEPCDIIPVGSSGLDVLRPREDCGSSALGFFSGSFDPASICTYLSDGRKFWEFYPQCVRAMQGLFRTETYFKYGRPLIYGERAQMGRRILHSDEAPDKLWVYGFEMKPSLLFLNKYIRAGTIRELLDRLYDQGMVSEPEYRGITFMYYDEPTSEPCALKANDGIRESVKIVEEASTGSKRVYPTGIGYVTEGQCMDGDYNLLYARETFAISFKLGYHLGFGGSPVLGFMQGQIEENVASCWKRTKARISRKARTLRDSERAKTASDRVVRLSRVSRARCIISPAAVLGISMMAKTPPSLPAEVCSRYLYFNPQMQYLKQGDRYTKELTWLIAELKERTKTIQSLDRLYRDEHWYTKFRHRSEYWYGRKGIEMDWGFPFGASRDSAHDLGSLVDKVLDTATKKDSPAYKDLHKQLRKAYNVYVQASVRVVEGLMPNDAATPYNKHFIAVIANYALNVYAALPKLGDPNEPKQVRYSRLGADIFQSLAEWQQTWICESVKWAKAKRRSEERKKCT